MSHLGTPQGGFSCLWAIHLPAPDRHLRSFGLKTMFLTQNRTVRLCENSYYLCTQLGFNDFSVWRTVKSEHIFPLYTCPILARQPHEFAVLVQIFDLATAPISKRPKSLIWLTLTIRLESGGSEYRKIIETKPKK